MNEKTVEEIIEEAIANGTAIDARTGKPHRAK